MLAALDKQSETTQQGFCDAMDDDFNTSGALAALFELVRTLNTARDAGATDAELKPGRDTLAELTGVLGLRLVEKKSASGDSEKFISLLIEVRAEARKQKNWELSDLIRDRLKELGVIIEDGKDGTSWHS
jgi:cysteinyl-tRNA synthetase